MAAAACGPWLLLLLLAFSSQAIDSASGSRSQAKAGAVLDDDNFVLALSSSTARLSLAQGSRAFRGSIRTLIMTDNETAVPHLNKVYGKYNEAYEFYPDERGPNTSRWHAKNPGDLRAAVAPFAAHRRFGDTYKWLLYGDDDTIFFMPGVRKLLAAFDPELPLAISDNLWYDASHPRLEAFRCLPCGFDASRLPAAQNATGYLPRPACPYCTPADACPPAKPDCDSTGAHGGAGMIFSVGLMRRLPYDDAMACMLGTYHCSGGDCLVSHCVWRAGFGFTDPGHSMRFDNPLAHVTFDNMENRWFLRNPIEQLTLGNCGQECRSVLRNAVSFHLRGKSYPSFPKAAAGVFGLVESHAAALEFLDLLEDRASRGEPPEEERAEKEL